MSPEVRARVFDPFFSTKPIGMGTGLGLSICHSIIQRFGGEIELNGALGHGTTARVVLVASDEAAVTQERSPASVRSAGARILVVDDELAFARVLGEALDYHDVTVLGSARAARMLCANQSFDCILCDLMMPDLDGPGFYEALQADGRGLEKRIVFMTGGAFTPRARQFLSSIPNVCVDKPLSIRSVEEVVREMVTGS
jgi:two-component system cell cycle sensor histidine kinase/response regulator CckA